MILSTLSQSDRYAALHPLFPRAFEYIRNTDLLALAPGRYPIVGEQLFVIVENVAGRTREAAKLECHHTHEHQNYMQGHSESTRQQYVGDIVSCANRIVQLTEMRNLKGEPVTTAPSSGHRVQIPLQGELAKGMLARFL